MLQKLGKHAVVIGGSMAGLLAARVLSDYFDLVTILERDAHPMTPDPRKGVPQGHHAHGLLAAGYQAMARLFPSLETDLARAGAVINMDPGQQLKMYQFGGFRAPVDTDMRGCVMSRPLLEWCIRKAVAEIPAVTMQTGVEVESLISDEAKRRVVGVRVQQTKGAGATQSLYADMVVDTSGRGSQMSKWLQTLGYDQPEESMVRVNVGYASRIYGRSVPNEDNPNSYLVITTPPHEKRLGVLFPIEGQRWLLTLAGICEDYPPTDEEGFRTFAHSLPVPHLAEVIEGEEPLGDIMQFRFPANFRRHYERMMRFPEGLLVMGDAMCSFNPIYGQGMTTSAMEAETLQSILSRTTTVKGIASTFFAQIRPIMDGAWQMTTGEDFRYPEVLGTRPAGTAFLHGYVERVHRASHVDPYVHKAFAHVMHMIEPPTSLFHPAVLFRVLRHTWFRPRQPIGA